MLSLALIAMLLPSYPSSALPNVPDEIRVAQHYESINPYTCIRYASNYLATDDESTDKKKISTSQRLYALNALASCQITAEEIRNAQQTIELISRVPVEQNNINEQILTLVEHNRERIHMYELTQNSMRQRDSSHSATPEFRGPLKIEDLKTYSYLMNAINSIHAGNFIEAGSTIDYLNKSRKIDSGSDYNLWEMLYLTNSYLYQQTDENARAFNNLGKLYSLYTKNEQTFYAALVAKEMASILAQAGFYKHAVYLQRIYLKTIEKIPEYKTKYIRGLTELTSYELGAGDSANTYTMLLKSELLLENSEISINDQAFANEQLGYAFKMLGDRTRATKYLENAARIFKNEKSIDNYDNVTLNLIELYINSGKLDSAQKLLRELIDLAPQLPSENQIYIKYLSAKLYAAKKNYQQAYSTIKSIFLANSGLMPNKQLQKKLKKVIGNSNFSEPHDQANNNNNTFDLLDKNENMITKDSSLSNPVTYLLLLFSLFLLLVYSITKRNNTLLRKELSILKNAGVVNKINDLPNENDLISYLFSLNYNSKVIGKKTEHTLPQEQEIYNIFIPGLSKLAIEKGNDKTKQIERLLTDKINQYIEQSAGRIYRISKDRYIIVKNKSSDSDSQQACSHLMNYLEQSLTELHLPNIVNIGAIEYPFLINSAMEITENKLIELSLLALHASCYISQKTNKSCWVVLPSISIEKKFPISGDIREIAVEAFERGILHFYVSHGRELIDWGDLLTDHSIQQTTKAPTDKNTQ